MSIETAISHVRMAMDAFPDNPEMVTLTIKHCENLMQPSAPSKGKTTAKVKTLTMKDVKKQCTTMAKDNRAVNKAVMAFLTEKKGNKSLTAVLDSDQETLRGVLGAAKNAKPEPKQQPCAIEIIDPVTSTPLVPNLEFDVLDDTPTRKDVKILYSRLKAKGFNAECKKIQKEVSGMDNLGSVSDPEHFKEMIRRAKEELMK